MKIFKISLAIGCFMLIGVSGAKAQDKSKSGCWPWPDSLDALSADPQNHTVMYSDGDIRVVDVHTPPHTTNTTHDHQWASVFLQDEAQPLGRDHAGDGSVTEPGGVVPADAAFPLLNVTGTQGPHAFENLDTFTKHFYRVEFKKIPFECPGKGGAMVSRSSTSMQTVPTVKVANWSWPASMDSVITSQETDNVLFENFDLRFVEVTIKPGQKQKMGETLWPSVLMFFEPQPGGVETFYDGKTAQVGRKFEGAKFPQAIRMGPQPPHAFENTDAIPAHYYRVEFKKINYKG